MRRVIVVIAFLVVLLAIDAVANDFRFTTQLIAELREFVRIVNRFVANTPG